MWNAYEFKKLIYMKSLPKKELQYYQYSESTGVLSPNSITLCSPLYTYFG